MEGHLLEIQGRTPQCRCLIGHGLTIMTVGSQFDSAALKSSWRLTVWWTLHLAQYWRNGLRFQCFCLSSVFYIYFIIVQYDKICMIEFLFSDWKSSKQNHWMDFFLKSVHFMLIILIIIIVQLNHWPTVQYCIVFFNQYIVTSFTVVIKWISFSFRLIIIFKKKKNNYMWIVAT